MSDAVWTRAVPARWNARATRFVTLNVAGGAAVLASYAWGLGHLGENAARAWGGVPEGLRPIYQTSMLLAAAGYFPMTLFVLAGLRSGRSTETVTLFYAAILACSAAWLPLTCAMLDRPSATLWWMIRIDLAIVGMASLAVLAIVLGRSPSGLRAAAIAGALAFSTQTALLDAIVWPAYFFAPR